MAPKTDDDHRSGAAKKKNSHSLTLPLDPWLAVWYQLETKRECGLSLGKAMNF